jgi:competence protein CoiA
MKFAHVDHARVAAFPGGAADCCFCRGRMIAKCGDRIAWHWAHCPRPRCDPWWENETDWHRVWKNCFPDAWQEVIHIDAANGERHIADVKTPSGVIIEFQNSPMNSAELTSREAFYKTVLWVVNAISFDFTILEPMPDPDSEFGSDCVFVHQHAFTRKSDSDSRRVHIRPCEPHIEEVIADNYVGHHAFEWNRAREVWLRATRPVYLDVGGPDLWLIAYEFCGYLEKRKSTRLGTARRVSKVDFVESHGGTFTRCGQSGSDGHR